MYTKQDIHQSCLFQLLTYGHCASCQAF
jgi:hypothetical protein